MSSVSQRILVFQYTQPSIPKQRNLLHNYSKTTQPSTQLFQNNATYSKTTQPSTQLPKQRNLFQNNATFYTTIPKQRNLFQNNTTFYNLFQNNATFYNLFQNNATYSKNTMQFSTQLLQNILYEFYTYFISSLNYLYVKGCCMCCLVCGKVCLKRAIATKTSKTVIRCLTQKWL